MIGRAIFSRERVSKSPLRRPSRLRFFAATAATDRTINRSPHATARIIREESSNIESQSESSEFFRILDSFFREKYLVIVLLNRSRDPSCSLINLGVF